MIVQIEKVAKIGKKLDIIYSVDDIDGNGIMFNDLAELKLFTQHEQDDLRLETLRHILRKYVDSPTVVVDIVNKRLDIDVALSGAVI